MASHIRHRPRDAAAPAAERVAEPVAEPVAKPAAEPGAKPGAEPAASLKRLLHWDELPEWQKDNEYIHTGYVRSQNSMAAVLRSLGFVHNETGNVYSHLVPAAATALLLCFAAMPVTPPFVLFGAGCVLCMGLSAAFHCLKSHSLRVATLGNKLDYLGICILIAASMIALIDVAFHDLPRQHHLFVGITSGLGLACSVVSLLDRFRTRQFRPYRATMFVLYGLSGVLPVVAASLEFGYAEASRRACCPWLYAEAFFYIFGAFLYAARFPERCSPGNFDLWGHSHQIFHVFVVIAAYCHYLALVGASRYASTHGA